MLHVAKDATRKAQLPTMVCTAIGKMDGQMDEGRQKAASRLEDATKPQRICALTHPKRNLW
jgi:hypothetical protein